MKSLEIYDGDNREDDLLEPEDPAHEEDETNSSGGFFVKRKFGSTLDKKTVAPNPLDAELLATADPIEDVVEIYRYKTGANDNHKADLPRNVSPATAREQMKAKLKAAEASFGKLPKLAKVSSNDNFKPVVSWPFMDQLTRPTFEPKPERRLKLTLTARYLRDLIDLADADPMGADCEVQKTETGIPGNGLTFDRRARTYTTHKDGEIEAVRYDGQVRTSKYAMPTKTTSDAPFPVRVMMAREELAMISKAVGPSWPHLVAVISENATLTDIGKTYNKRGSQASAKGTAVIRAAMNSAVQALGRINGVKDDWQAPTPMPVKSHGSFWSHARVFKSGCYVAPASSSKPLI